MYHLLCRSRVDPFGDPTDLEAATRSETPEHAMLCSELDSEPCRIDIANDSHAGVQLMWYSYEGAGA